MKPPKVCVLAVTAAALLMVADKAWCDVFVDEAKIRQWCLGAEVPYAKACDGYISATYDRIWAYGKFYDETFACPPKNLTPAILTETVIAFLKARTKMTAGGPSATLVVLEALKDKWPCGAGVNTGSMVKMDTFRTRCTGSSVEQESWCTGFVAGSIDASAAMYEVGDDGLFDFQIAVSEMNWGTALETVRRFVADHDDLKAVGFMPYYVIEKAIIDAGAVSE